MANYNLNGKDFEFLDIFNQAKQSVSASTSFQLPGKSTMDTNITKTSPTQGGQDIDAIDISTFKAPTFWRNHIRYWFTNLELQFELRKIKQDKAKFCIVTSNLDAEAFELVSDVICNPPPKQAYETIKKSLIKRLEESDHQKVVKLISGLHLGDKKPSVLLRQMRELVGHGLDMEKIIKHLWLQRLPANVQAIIASNLEASLDDLAASADSITEICPSLQVYGVTNQPQQYSTPSTSTSSQIEFLTNSLHSLMKNQEAMQKQILEFSLKSDAHSQQRIETNPTEHNPRQFRRNSFNSNNPRRASPNRSRSPTNQTTNRNICFYHLRFGKDAKKCTKPCIFASGNE
jgi:hypothetical protein